MTDFILEMNFPSATSTKRRYIIQVRNNTEPSYYLLSNRLYMSNDVWNEEAYSIALTQFAVTLKKPSDSIVTSIIYIQIVDIGPYLYSGLDYSQFTYTMSSRMINSSDNYCPFSCNNNGTCSNSTCTCNDNYMGASCSIPATNVTQDTLQSIWLNPTGTRYFFYKVKRSLIDEGSMDITFTHYVTKNNYSVQIFMIRHQDRDNKIPSSYEYDEYWYSEKDPETFTITKKENWTNYQDHWETYGFYLDKDETEQITIRVSFVESSTNDSSSGDSSESSSEGSSSDENLVKESDLLWFYITSGIIAGILAGLTCCCLYICLKRKRYRVDISEMRNPRGRNATNFTRNRQQEFQEDFEGVFAGHNFIDQNQPIYQQRATPVHRPNPKYNTLDDHTINKYFPQKKFSEKEKNIFNQTSCMVCLIDFDFNDIVRKVEICKHVFHPKCLMMWLQREESCPLCKTGLSRPECLHSQVVFSDEIDQIDNATNNLHNSSLIKMRGHRRAQSNNTQGFSPLGERLDTMGP